MRKRTTWLSLVPALHRATHRVGLYIEAAALGVSQGEAHVLAHLHQGACSIADLHQAFAHRRSTLTSILDRLEGRGLVRRRLREEDRRSFRVCLTPRGRGLARAVHAALAELEALVASRVRLADGAGFEAVMDALQQASRPAVRRKP